MRVEECLLGTFKRQAVLLLVDPFFVWVPFKRHMYILMYLHSDGKLKSKPNGKSRVIHAVIHVESANLPENDGNHPQIYLVFFSTRYRVIEMRAKIGKAGKMQNSLSHGRSRWFKSSYAHS